MDVCPISFSARVPLQLNPEFVSGNWTAPAGTTQVFLTFDANMDLSVTPATASFELTLDGVTRGVNTATWISPRVLFLDSVAGIPPVDPVTIELLVEDNDLHALAGNNVLPFGPETIPEL